MKHLDDSEARWIEAIQRERQAEVDRFNARRSIEWRLAITLWGGFGLAANAVRGVTLDEWGKWTLAIGAGVVVGLHALWVWKFMVENSVPNWEAGQNLTGTIRGWLGITFDQREPNRWGYWWQVVVTLVFAAFMVVLLFAQIPVADSTTGK